MQAIESTTAGATISQSYSLSGIGQQACTGPILLAPGDLLALPVSGPGGRVAAALLLGCGAVPVAARPLPTAPDQGAERSGSKHNSGAASRVNGDSGGGVGRGSSGGELVELRSGDLAELRRLAQFLGFGMFSDPQQAAYLEQVVVVLVDVRAGGGK
jgi:hypothetical protein